MKPGHLGRPATFTIVLSVFATSIILIQGVELLDLEGDNAEAKIEFVDQDEIIQEAESQLKLKSCVELSHYPLQCIQKGCTLDEISGECRNAHTHPKSEYLQQLYSIPIPTIRKKRDADSKCFHFNQSPRLCLENGCKYDNEKKKCVNLDGSQDKEPTEKPQSLGRSVGEKKTYKFMEKPTVENCNKYHGKPLACGYAGCNFERWTHRCRLGRSKSSSGSGTSPNAKPKDGDDDKKGKPKDGGDDGDDDEDSDEVKDCGKYDGSSSKCNKNGCTYDDKTKICRQKADGAGGKDPKSKGRTAQEACSQFKSDLSNCVKSASGCLFNETSEECIEAQELTPADGGGGSSAGSPGGKSRDTKYCNFLYGKKKNCKKAGCEHDSKNKKCDAGAGNFAETDTVSITYVETKPVKLKHTAEECSEFDNSPRGCLFAGCQFDEEASKCLIGTGGVISVGYDMSFAEITAKYLTGEECAVFNKKMRPCKNAGCRYLENKETCISGERKSNTEQCSALDEKPVPCVQQGCLYDVKHKKCFVSDFHEVTHTITYVKVKTTRKKLVMIECSEMDGSPGGCAFAQCKYDEGKKKCQEREGGDDKESDGTGKKGQQLTTPECSVLDKKLRGCGYAGCRYMTRNQKCIIDTDATTGCGVMDGDEESCNEAGCSYDKVKYKCRDNGKGDGRGFGGDADGPSAATCAKFNGKRKSCTKAGCAYDKTTKTCSAVDADDDKDGGEGTEAPSDSKDCGKFNSKPKKCIAAGCEYDKATKTCSTGGEDGSDGPEGDGGGANDICSKHDGKRKSCSQQAGCKYDKSTKKCSGGDGTPPSDPANCGQYEGKMRECKKAGCEYDKGTKECSPKDDDEGDAKDGGGGKDEDGDGTTDAPEDCEKHDGKQKGCIKAGCKYIKATKKCTSRGNDGSAESGKGSGGEGDDDGEGGDDGGESGGKDGEDDDKETAGKKDDKGPSDDCAKYNGKQKSCVKAGCKYYKPKKTCSAAATIESGGETEETRTTTKITRRSWRKFSAAECSELDESQRACSYVGCLYEPKPRKCLVEENEEVSIKTSRSEKILTTEECSVFDGKPSACNLVDCCRYLKKSKKCTTAPKTDEDSSSSSSKSSTSGTNVTEVIIIETGDQCTVHDGKRKSCVNAGCKYDKGTKKCSGTKEAEYETIDETHTITKTTTIKGSKTSSTCSVYDGKSKACRSNGCKYVKQDKKCIDDDKASDDKKPDLTTTTAKPTTTAPPTQEECAKLSKKMKKCTKAGCLYDNVTGKCDAINEAVYEDDAQETYTILPNPEGDEE